MIPFAAGFVAALWLVHQLPALPPPWIFAALATTLVASMVTRRPAALPAILAGTLAGLLLGTVHATTWLDRVVTQAEPEATLSGRVVDLPRHGERSSRFHLATHGDPPRRLEVSVYPPRADVGAGDLLRLKGRLYPPQGRANRTGFDREAWFYRAGLHGRLNVSAADLRHAVDGTAPGALRGALHRQRATLRDRLQAAAPELRHPGLVQALVIGERSGMTDAEWAAFLQTGTNHLMAISGLHVGLVAGFAALLATLLWRHVAAVRERWPRRVLAAAAAALVALGYAALAGFSIPTQRALLMLLAVLAALLLGRGGTPWRALVLAALIILIRDPPGVLAPGFWFSFGAVAVILGLLQGRRSRPGLREAMAIQVLLALAMLPLALAWFQLGSWIAPLANIVAVPLISFVVLPVLLTGAGLAMLWPPLGGPPLWLGDAVLGLLVTLLQALADLPAAVAERGVPLAAALLAGLAVIFLLLPGRRRMAPWVLLAALPLGLPLRPDLSHGELRAELLDTGREAVVLLETRNHVVVYGPGRARDVESALLPALRARQRNRIDRVIVADGLLDDSGSRAAALQALTAAVEVERVLHRDERHPRRIRESGPVYRACRAGQQWQRDGVVFRVLHPPRGWDASRAASCVLRIETAGGAVLLTGGLRGLGAAVLGHETPDEDLQARLLVTAEPAKAVDGEEGLAGVRAPTRWVAGTMPDGPDRPGPVDLRATATDGALRLRAGTAWEPGAGWRNERRRFWQRPHP